MLRPGRRTGGAAATVQGEAKQAGGEEGEAGGFRGGGFGLLLGEGEDACVDDGAVGVDDELLRDLVGLLVFFFKGF
jgi:hypothetical protein